MGTVGINFGAATSGAGFDVATTVTAILSTEQAIETPWQTQLTALTAQDTALSGLGTNLSSLATALQSLTDFDGVFATKQGSSSDTNVLTLTSASSAAVAGSHTVQVTSLAATSSKYSDSISNAGDALSGSLTLAVGSSVQQTITLGAGDNTLAGLATAINNGSYGVTASVVTDASGSRLSLVSATSGAQGNIALTSSLTDQTTSAAVAFATGQTGVDAVLTVDGLATTSASNTVTGAIPGVTFQLLASSPGTDVQVQITNDNASIESAVQTLVTAYNGVVSAAATQEGKDASGNAEPLFGSPTLSLIQGQLASALTGGAAAGAVSSVGQLGISVNPDGSLTFSQSTLDSALNAHFNDVAGYLQGAGSFGQALTSTLNGLSASSQSGAIYLAVQQNAAVEKQLNTNVTNENALLATQKTSLTSELNLANEELQAIPQQLNEVNELYSAITGYNQQQN